jgi:putative transposase
MVGALVRRRQVVYLREGGVSVRRACALMSVARSALHYQSQLVRRDAPAVAVMHELAAQYPRYGYRRIQVFLARRGHVMSAYRAHRLWRLHELQVPRKRPRRRVATGRPRPLPATGAGQMWAYDFVFDACANGQQLKCLTVIDEFTRECLASVSITRPDRTLSARSQLAIVEPRKSGRHCRIAAQAPCASR